MLLRKKIIFEFDSYESAHAKGIADELMRVSYDVTNNTNKNIYLNMYSHPILITKDKIQVEAISMDAQRDLEDETLFAGCKTDFSFWIPKNRVDNISYGDKFIFNLDIDGEDKVIESEVGYFNNKPKGSGGEFSLSAFMLIILILFILLILMS